MPVATMGAVGARPATGGAPPFAPTDITGCGLWLDASDAASITAAGGLISQWSDKSGQGNHVVQATSANRPTTGAATLAGMNVVVFDGADTLNRAPVLRPGQHEDEEDERAVVGIGDDVTVFAVFRKTGAANTYESFPVTLTAASAPRPLDRYNNELIAPPGASNVAAATDLRTQTAWCQITLQADSAAPNVLTEWKNGTQTVTGNTAGTLGSSGQAITLGSRGDLATHFTGELAEAVVYGALLNTTDRQTVEAYLRTKWGTPAPLR
jgi:hypothetical protein